jgi:DNA polymerase-3 subunit gamma/tau
MRDAEVMLEQLIALGEGRVELKTASEFLGVLPLKEIKELLKTAFSGDKEALLSKVGRLEEGGYNPVAVAKRLLEATEREFISPSFLSEEECVAAFKILSDCLKELPHHPYPYTLLLFYLYRLSYFKEVKRLSELLKGKALKLEEERGEPEEREKKIKYDTLEAYIAEVIDEGNRVRVVAAHSLGFSKLKERLRELREKYGKEVLVEPPSESSTRKREISKESKELVSKLAKALEAKVLYWEPKET